MVDVIARRNKALVMRGVSTRLYRGNKLLDDGGVARVAGGQTGRTNANSETVDK